MKYRAHLLTVLLTCFVSVLSTAAQTPMAIAQPDTSSISNRITKVTAEVSAASARVRLIVNQPVAAVVRTRNMEACNCPYWFHEGAMMPDYEKVDVRKTQEFPYDKCAYIYSDLNPSTAYIGRQLEFNSMTKIFYVDRSVPKKKLTQAEMVEINRLYRIIGHGLKELGELKNKT